MEDLNLYIYEELKNIPFDLFKLLTRYVQVNKKVKVAFVGGYIRDLLIKRFHSNYSFQTIDYDLVIEGSSLSLAKFIKKNIVNVEICLIKEFGLYNTVELNINKIKVDIASARVEKYIAPGVNPSVIDSNLKDDLRRRDFSVNSIAYEISEKKIYDPFEGINHIQKKELHLLHKNSIRDDPSRVLRCSKYAIRLGFEISNKSLLQSQELIKEWPWKYTKNSYGYKFPPAISIRIRMEITEILKYDDLAKVIRKLAEWNVLSLLNENIKLNNKFIRGLNWLVKLKGNPILYLIKDSNSLDIISDRYFINHKEKKYLKDLIELKKFIKNNEKAIYEFSPSSWTKLIEENNLNPETIKLIICEGGIFWRHFLKWLIIYRHIKSNKDGEVLKKEGWKAGKELGEELKRLRYLNIDNYKRY